MKTDTLFYEIFQTQPGLLLELLGRDVSEIVNYDFRSVEVKQTAFRIDGLLIPKRAGTPAPVYFSEVQFQKDPQLYHRFFAEIFTYLKQYPHTPSWHGILIYPRRSLVPPRRYWELYRTLLASDQVTHIYLEDLRHTDNLPLGLAIIQLVVEPKKRAKGFARQLVQRVQQSASSPIGRDRLLDLIETILVYKFGSLTTKEIEAMFGLSELKKTRVFQEGREEGREEGVEAGREVGQVDERRNMIETTLKVRFAKIDRALAATIPALMALPPRDRMQVLLNASREDLIDRFSPKA
jgi:predicted transposase/invertase (TIGR01784 family)